jgi:hypothetical protein
MAAGAWFDWTTGDLVTEARFQDIQDSIVFIYDDETAANAALTNKVEGTIFYDKSVDQLKAWNGSAWIGAEAGDIEGVTAGTNLNGGGTSGTVTVNLDSTVTSVALQDYSEVDVAVTSSSGVIAIDMDNGNTGSITLTENITDIDFTNVPASGVATFTLQITQDSTDRTVAINAVTVNGGGDVTALTAGGAGYTMSTGSGAIDLVTFLFLDAGTPLLNALQNFS